MLQAHFVATGSQEGDPGETFGIHDLKFPHAVRGVGGIGAGHGLKTTRALAYEHGFPDLVVVAPAADASIALSFSESSYHFMEPITPSGVTVLST